MLSGRTAALRCVDKQLIIVAAVGGQARLVHVLFAADSPTQGPYAGLEALTEREREVLTVLSEGEARRRGGVLVSGRSGGQLVLRAAAMTHPGPRVEDVVPADRRPEVRLDELERGHAVDDADTGRPQDQQRAGLGFLPDVSAAVGTGEQEHASTWGVTRDS